MKGERGLMVDDGRKYFTPVWLGDDVRELAYLKLNTLHLHLADNEGFRIESTTHPEIVSADHLSRQDIRQLMAFAAQRHVTVVPEIDTPGHMAAILAAHPELQLYDTAQALSARLGSHPDTCGAANRCPGEE